MKYLIVMSLIFIGCAYPLGKRTDQPKRHRRIEAGNTINDVRKILCHDTPVYVGSKIRAGHKVEVWNYKTLAFNWCGNDYTAKEYNFYFCDNKLIKWSSVKIENNWGKEANTVLLKHLYEETVVNNR